MRVMGHSVPRDLGMRRARTRDVWMPAMAAAMGVTMARERGRDQFWRLHVSHRPKVRKY